MTPLDWLLLTWWIVPVAGCWAMDHFGWGADLIDGTVCA